ncbi:MAG: aspartate ammonia-lyase [Candidatus Melainabacteria bacterium RIFOXYA12_FULL_32_12]|nr:MAG: aspartate ammonia-lyase [Candidatus Melainabacteria bacterium RIFOXYA2_FULL_32_9]OGI24896.1 MAG: aspartate ammonia-lyase [Candidatus Melainabacteria bacterium RIFOXYA12_FULL_32_12]
MSFREESDFLGTVRIPQEAYWGIHTYRANQNFKISGYRIDREFIKALGYVKLACILTIKEMNKWSDSKANAILQACEDLIEGKLDDQIIVDPIQGGAGTSTNMNVNEVIANRALELMGKEKGDYKCIDPLEDINLYQSTNDVYPTALKIASIFLMKELEQEVIALQESFQAKEREFADIVKVARTQLMDAVLITLGKEFSAYAEAISRDRWRIYKCEERLRVVNIGGTAVGTGLCAPRKFIFGVIEKLRELTGLGLARAENLVENTQNLDVFSEVSGILNAHAASLIKIANDLRLLNSGPQAGLSEITLPPVQVGSSIMPGKVNPVIPEVVAQSGIKVLGNNVIINQCVAGGQLELNQNIPLIAFTLIESLRLLINANKTFRERCITGITANNANIKKSVECSYASITALVPVLGYKKVSQIAKELEKTDMSVKDFVVKNNYITEEEFDSLTSPEAILALGHTKSIDF